MLSLLSIQECYRPVARVFWPIVAGPKAGTRELHFWVAGGRAGALGKKGWVGSC
jgi:hypothetical protein